MREKKKEGEKCWLERWTPDPQETLGAITNGL